MDKVNIKIGILGLGYVGLPLAIEFAKKFKVVGFDIKEHRILELQNSLDGNNEVNTDDLQAVLRGTDCSGLVISSESQALKDCNIYIVTVPTPIDEFKAPDLEPLLKASNMLSKFLKKGDIIIYESTVYPGCTEEDCVPVLELGSGLTYNEDFFCGYSPERINPGDRINTLTKIKKVTSGSTPEVANFVDNLYKEIITAGTHKAPSMKVAEASKSIENAQRDVNISFVNELALIFDRMGIDTQDVLEAAATKWNFLHYKPGLVGGHCISVDPYYLAHKAIRLGYHPEVILSGRRVNDNMGMFVANKLVKLLIAKQHVISQCKVLVLGITFKEDCPDIRNSRVIDIVSELKQFQIEVDVHDPHADAIEVKNQYQIDLVSEIDQKYDGIILAVSHKEFKNLDITRCSRGPQTVIYDIKSFLDRSLVNGRL
jgi:UDP-N-acetyl-D-galactosamine dehydrogenase